MGGKKINGNISKTANSHTMFVSLETGARAWGVNQAHLKGGSPNRQNPLGCLCRDCCSYSFPKPAELLYLSLGYSILPDRRLQLPLGAVAPQPHCRRVLAHDIYKGKSNPGRWVSSWTSPPPLTVLRVECSSSTPTASRGAAP